MDPDKNELPPGIENISREKMSVQEEFIEAEAEPSIDISEVTCPRCGKPRREWTGSGVERGNIFYCCEQCTEESALD